MFCDWSEPLATVVQDASRNIRASVNWMLEDLNLQVFLRIDFLKRCDMQTFRFIMFFGNFRVVNAQLQCLNAVASGCERKNF